jgi:hypothetical protein
MSPGGHLVTTVAACVATAYATSSVPLTAAVATGGFLIDVDHAIDYVLFDRQLDLRPHVFLRYFIEGRVRLSVLMLHSYELFALLGVLAWWLASPLLAAYLVGAVMHLALDIVFNGRVTPYSIFAYYSFAYRLSHRFQAGTLLGMSSRPGNAGFWTDFFRGTPELQPLPRAGAEPAPARGLPDPLA